MNFKAQLTQPATSVGHSPIPQMFISGARENEKDESKIGIKTRAKYPVTSHHRRDKGDEILAIVSRGCTIMSRICK